MRLQKTNNLEAKFSWSTGILSLLICCQQPAMKVLIIYNLQWNVKNAKAVQLLRLCREVERQTIFLISLSKIKQHSGRRLKHFKSPTTALFLL